MNYLHLMKKVAIAILFVLSVANAQDKRFAFKGNAAQAGSDFVWHVTDSAEVSDSLRFIQGSNITLTQSGNTLTIAGAAGAGSTASVRANVGWTASGTLARDTLYTNYALFGAKTFGVGGTTQAQNARAKFNVLGRAANDTLAVLSNDGGGVVHDSSWIWLSDGSLKLPDRTVDFLITGATNMQLGSLKITQGAGISDNGYGGSVTIVGTSGAINITSANSKNIRLTPAAQLLIGASTKSSQAYTTINSNGTADTTFMVRNNKASGTDSTVFFTATGDIDAGGNNFYIGANRVRSVTGDTAFVFYSGTTQVFAILADGSTADLVAGTPPSSRRYNPPPDYIWLLRIGVLLLLLLVAFKVHDYIYKADEMKWKIIRSGIRGK